jgi:hypothetical protein
MHYQAGQCSKAETIESHDMHFIEFSMCHWHAEPIMGGRMVSVQLT